MGKCSEEKEKERGEEKESDGKRKRKGEERESRAI